MEIGLRVPLAGRGRAPRRGRPARPAAARRRPRAAGRQPHARAAQRRAGRRADLRADDLPSAHAARRGLSVAARRRRPRRASTLPAEAFVQTIARVARSASRDETRPVLTGILMSASGQELRMVATDSYRLSVKETALERRCRAASRRTFRPARCRSSCASPSRRRARRSPSASGRTRSSSSSATSCSPRA